MSKNIIIVWGENTSDEVSISDFSSPWATSTGDTLHLVDFRNDYLAVFEYIDKYKYVGEALVFLHETPPHSYTELHRIELVNLFANHQLAVRVRIFSGGHGKLYCKEINLNGILGARGRLSRIIETKTRPVKIIPANVILTEPERQISQTHFDYVWNAYWDTPKEKVFDLLERFNGYARGFDWDKNDRQGFIRHLQSDNDLWQQMHAFAEMALVGEVAMLPANADFSLKDFEANLAEKHLTHLNKTRDGFKKIIQEGHFNAGCDKDTVSDAYDALFIVYKDIVQIDEKQPDSSNIPAG